MSLELAVVTFKHQTGAELAFADAREAAGDVAWLDEVAFVQRRPRGRIIVRGTFGGRYVDIDGLSDVIGPDTVAGGLTGALVGAAFGPAIFSGALIAGLATGGLVQSEHIPDLEGELFDELRTDVPPGSSAIVLLADTRHVNEMIQALGADPEQTTRRTLSSEALAALERCVKDVPAAGAAEWT